MKGFRGMENACVTMERNAVSFEHSIEPWMPGTIRVRPSDHDLTLIIPAFNEGQRLPWTLDQLAKFLDSWAIDYRVLVVDDGSSDHTATLTDVYGPRFSTLRLMQQGGKGRAVRTAMLKATGRVLAFTDADLPFDLDALCHGYELIVRGEAQTVFGARDLAESKHLAPRHWSRQIATRLFQSVVKTMISTHITDTQCGLKLFARQAALDIFSQATIDGFAFDAEVVALTHQLDLSFKRIPVTLMNDYGSTISLRRNALPMLADVLRIWWRARITQSKTSLQMVTCDNCLNNQKTSSLLACSKTHIDLK
jgi:dolichyl-phosphate beta-glucosyltransferase